MVLMKQIMVHIWQDVKNHVLQSRSYSSRIDWVKLRPLILKKIENRERGYIVKDLVPVAHDVFNARAQLVEGVSALLNVIPIKACEFCPEIHLGNSGHLIKTCNGRKHTSKNCAHTWIDGDLRDILVRVESFHRHNISQDGLKHGQFCRVPAVLELCSQAGLDIPDEILYAPDEIPENRSITASPAELRSVAQVTLEAWERLRLGVKKLLFVYPANTCEYCLDIRIGNRSQLHGVFKRKCLEKSHHWKRASVDTLVPPKVVWYTRPQDPSVLLDSGRGYYGRAPAVVGLCAQAGAWVPKTYFRMMKLKGFTLENAIRTGSSH
ncbi:hypothetical protein H6P81_019562 [Aristolochia fimbriata]|uniref:APO domain-containing protein n=1 Tax=Aristolochia fimbriata TaxID=158543 RepID=A0AAV7DV90_ARIFI|nr:hypothetical protein H6P81_019562 [Aristolochia fimbriata]